MSLERPTVWGASVYPRNAASTRLRLDLLREPLERRGCDFRGWSYLPEGDLNKWIDGGPGRVAPAVRGVPRTFEFLRESRSASAVVVQREILPWNTLRPEIDVARRGPVVWDVDDAMWLSAGGIRGRVRGTEAKYVRLAQLAAEVWAGSENVAEWCEGHGARTVRIVPTVTPIPARVSIPSDPPRLVWVGTPSTARYLQHLVSRHQQALQDWVLEVVGADAPAFPGLTVESYPWTQANEDRALGRAWAGLYPIDTTHDFSAGKSALKAVLMGAYGLPVLATRTRSNAAVVSQGTTGLLIDEQLGWEEALSIIRDPGVRHRLGSAARSKVELEFNPTKWGETLADALVGLR